MASFLNNAGRLMIVATWAIAPMAFAADKGYFGFAISVDAEGFSLNPVLKTVSIEKVTPGSPAEAAGLTKGDQFIEVEGRAGRLVREQISRETAGRRVAILVGQRGREIEADVLGERLFQA